MHYKQQSGFTAMFLDKLIIKIFEVECADSCFSCSCGCNYEVSVAFFYLTLKLQFFKHLYLVRFSFESCYIFCCYCVIFPLVSLIIYSFCKS